MILSLSFPLFFSSPRQEVGPPRPPLPKSYQPLETSQSFPPSIPPLPLDANAWLRSMGPHAGIHQESYKDEEEYHSRKVPQRRDRTWTNLSFPSEWPVSMFTPVFIIIMILITTPSPQSFISFTYLVLTFIPYYTVKSYLQLFRHC